jgi:hypothetical protein
VPVSVHKLGDVQQLPEAHHVLEARDKVKTILPMPFYCFRKQNGTYEYTSTTGNSQQEIGPQDMIYFGIQNSKACGLATCRMRSGDKIWYLPQTMLSFVVREAADGTTTITGRAYVFKDIESVVDNMTWTEWPYSDPRHLAAEPALVVHLNVAVMIALVKLANAYGERVKEDAEFRAVEEAKRRQEAEARAAEEARLKISKKLWRIWRKRSLK